MADRYAHCGYCGAAFAPEAGWPRRCAACGRGTYRNPLPVSVVLVPLGEGLLGVQRSIPPGVGAWALPGGYVTWGETWQEAGAREVAEETGLVVDPATITPFDVQSAPDGTLLIFGLAAPLALPLPPFTPTSEASACGPITPPMALAFSLHEAAVARYFAGDGMA